MLEDGSTVDPRTVPSIIGGDKDSRHGIVLAKSIPAKKYGIETAEPVAMAMRKCPGLLVLQPDFTLYTEKSRALMAFLSSYCPDIEQVSVDECYMDFTPIAARFSSPEAAAHEIKDAVASMFGFTVNIGISDRKVLAKMASDFEKPNKVHTLYASEIKEKMWPLPIGDLFLCGKSSAERMKQLGILTIGDLANTDPIILDAHFKSHGRLLLNYANGIDDSTVHLTHEKAKGVGNSTTMPKDALTKEEMLPVLRMLSDSVSARLRKNKQVGESETLEIKYADFSSFSHQMALPRPSDTSDVLYETAVRLFDVLWNGAPVRLLGIRVTHLSDSDVPIQLSLFDIAPERKAASEKQKKLDLAIDQIRSKFGKDSIVRGTHLKEIDPDDPLEDM